MAVPTRTAGQFLLENGFGQAPRSTLSFPEYPDLDAQLQAFRKLDPRALEISWLEYTLSRAREARVANDLVREQEELTAARRLVEDAFKRRTPRRLWPMLLAALALIGLLGFLWWLEQRRAKGARRGEILLANRITRRTLAEREEEELDEEDEEELEEPDEEEPEAEASDEAEAEEPPPPAPRKSARAQKAKAKP